MRWSQVVLRLFLILVLPPGLTHVATFHTHYPVILHTSGQYSSRGDHKGHVKFSHLSFGGHDGLESLHCFGVFREIFPKCNWTLYLKGDVYIYVLICLACHDRIPQTGWLKQQKCQPPRLEVQDQGAGKVGIWWDLFPWLTNSFLLTRSSHGLSFVHLKREREKELSGSSSSSYKVTSPVELGPHPFDLL